MILADVLPRGRRKPATPVSPNSHVKACASYDGSLRETRCRLYMTKPFLSVRTWLLDLL